MGLGTNSGSRSGPTGRFCASCPYKPELCRVEGSGPQSGSTLARACSKVPTEVQVTIVPRF